MDDAKYENLVTRYLENDPIIPDSQFPIAARFAPNKEKGLKQMTAANLSATAMETRTSVFK